MSNPAPGFQERPDYPISIQECGEEIIVTRDGVELARSSNAIKLSENTISPVYYLPREDVNWDAIEAIPDQTHCPYKGNASYWTLNGRKIAWSYETPYDEMLAISGYVAFYD